MENENGKKMLTQAGYEALQEELEHLKVHARKEIAEKIKEARAQGDLSENAEYDAAKDEQRDIEARIEEIELILKTAVVAEDLPDDDRINIGCTVTLLDVEFNEETEYQLVGSSEANSLKGRISNESPVGQELIGKEVGDTIFVETQAGMIEYRILKVERTGA